MLCLEILAGRILPGTGIDVVLVFFLVSKLVCIQTKIKSTLYVSIYVCLCLYVYVYMYLCVFVSVFIYIYIYICVLNVIDMDV